MFILRATSRSPIPAKKAVLICSQTSFAIFRRMPASEILFMRTYIGGFGPQCLFRNDNHRNQSFPLQKIRGKSVRGRGRELNELNEFIGDHLRLRVHVPHVAAANVAAATCGFMRVRVRDVELCSSRASENTISSPTGREKANPKAMLLAHLSTCRDQCRPGQPC